MANIAAFLPGLGLGALASGVGIAVVGYSDNSVKFEKIILNTSGEVISKYRELSCIKGLFETITWHADPDSNTTKQTIEKTDSTFSLTNNQTQGCISVWWQKETYGDYWRGAWNLLWGMGDDKYGTIFVSTITADRGIVQVDKYFYFLEKKTDKWTTTGKWAKDREVYKEEKKDELVVKFEDSLPSKENNLDSFISQTDKVCSYQHTCNKSSAYITVGDLNWKYVQETGSEDNQDTEKQWNKKISKWIKDKAQLGIDLNNVYKNTNGKYQLEEVVHNG